MDELYGSERSVIEIFDLLRPEVEPLFVISRSTAASNQPVFRELQRRGLATVCFSDFEPWPRIQWPQSLSEAIAITATLLRGNRDILRYAKGCDAIYLLAANYGYLSLIAMGGKPVFHHFHEFGLRPAWQVELINRFATAHIHTTEYGLRTVSTLYPSILRRCNVVIPHCIELPECSDSIEMLDAFCGRRNLVYAGQISRTKGVDILLDAFRLLAPRYPDIHLHLIGTLRDDEMAVTGERVIHWGFRDDVPAFFRNAWLAIQSTPPSRCAESFGRTAMEAALCGVPVVCFGSGALHELVIDGETGTICPDETPESMAAAIARYLDDPAMRDRHGANAKQRSTNLFSRSVIRNSWRKLFSLR